MAENVELEALDQLVKSDGWKFFTGQVAKEWGTVDGGGSQFVKAVSDAAKLEDANATAILRQIICAQREIHKLMQWVPNRLQMLKMSSQTSSQDFVGSRRGTL